MNAGGNRVVVVLILILVSRNFEGLISIESFNFGWYLLSVIKLYYFVVDFPAAPAGLFFIESASPLMFSARHVNFG